MLLFLVLVLVLVLELVLELVLDRMGAGPWLHHLKGYASDTCERRLYSDTSTSCFVVSSFPLMIKSQTPIQHRSPVNAVSVSVSGEGSKLLLVGLFVWVSFKQHKI